MPKSIPLLVILTSTLVNVYASEAEKFIVLTPCEVSTCASTPTIDGQLDANEWADATPLDSVYQIKPHEFSPPSEKTEFYVKFDENYLYVAGKFYDANPDKITAQVSRQGANIQDDDSFRVLIDPYNSKRAGYRFSVNLNEVRNEGIFLNVTTLSNDWSAIWDSKALLTDYGWSAEIAIPFKSLSFDTENQRWGFNAYRYIARKNELIGWVSKNQSDDASVSGEVGGIKEVNQGVGLDVVPSLSLKQSHTIDPSSTSFSYEPAMDVFYKITPSLNGALTFNTDFSATEVDDRQVDLTQFGLFFPEKRSFFLRDFDIFDFGGIGSSFLYSRFGGSQGQNARPFFSRKIGLSASGAPVDIIGGVKVSGKLGDANVGALIVQQQRYDDVEQDMLMIARASVDVLAESSIGVMITEGDPRSDLSNSVSGIDFRYRNSTFGTSRLLNGNFWYQQSSTEGTQNHQRAFGAMLEMPNPRAWRGLLQYQQVQKNFNPALGFISRRDVELYRGVAGYIYQLEDHPWIRKIYTGADIANWSYLSTGKLQSSTEFYRLVDVETHSGDRFNIALVRFGEGIYNDNEQPFGNLNISLPLQEHKWQRYGAFFRSSKSRLFNAKVSYYDGEFYTGDRVSASAEFGWRPTRKISLTAGYNYWDVKMPEGDFVLRQVDAKIEWSITPELSLVNVLQYDNISGDLGLNARLHWTTSAGQNVYLVYNQNYNELEGNGFERLNGDTTLKLNYTFRF